MRRQRRACDRGSRSLVPGSLIPAALVLRALVPAELVRTSLRLPLVPRALLLAGGRLQGRHCAGPVLHDPFECARAPLVEIKPARHRLETHLQALPLDTRPRQLHDEVVYRFVMQGIAPRVPLGVSRIQFRLDVERLDEWVRIEQQLEERPQQSAKPPDGRAVRLVQGVFAKAEVRRRRLGAAEAAILLEQARTGALAVEELLE